jgi:hypothetical protein
VLSAKDFDEIFEQSKHKRENAPRSAENDGLSAAMNLIAAVYSQTLIMFISAPGDNTVAGQQHCS